VRLSGAEIVLECLKSEGVKEIFGYPGGCVIPLYDALYSCEGLKHILVRHEQGAAHAADGYARATGKVGVCIATSGPGATNLVTGIANAYMDSVPMVVITGQVTTAGLGKDTFQEVDMTSITFPITKHNYLVKDVKDLPRVFKEAFHLASTGRPGPVLIDIPKDILTAKSEFSYPEEVRIRGYKPTYQGHLAQIRKIAKMVNQAKRPVIYAGGGVIISKAEAELLKMAEGLSIPVTTSLMGLGCFPEDHPLSLGMLGMHGTGYANYAINEADLLIALGTRFSDRSTGAVESFAPKAEIIHIDIDPAEIGKNIFSYYPVVGDVKEVLKALVQMLEPKENPDWVANINKWKEAYPLTYDKESNEIKPQYVIEEIRRITQGDGIIVTEVGQHQMWAALHYSHTKPRHFISSGGLGTMGYGLPAAIGAQMGRPDKVVFNIAGDGSIQMNIQELIVAVEHQLPIKIAILNNGYLGMVRQWQELFFNKRYSATPLNCCPDFVKLAEAYGAVGLRIEKKEDVSRVLTQAMSITDKPTVLDFRIAPEENVFPMVPPGGTVGQMIFGGGKKCNTY